MTPDSIDHFTSSPADALRVREGFVLAGQDTRATPAYDGDKASGRDDLAAGAGVLSELQERLFAQSTADPHTPSVLLVLQGMDSSGKGGIVRHVVGSVDPQGVDIASFKKPTAEELEHDFLWRIEKRVPGRGRIGVFDRSHYEDVLIGRVRELASPEEIERRYDAINEFEQRLVQGGTTVVKVMLNISYDEQRERLLERLDRPEKHWKFTTNDIEERSKWPHYMSAYQAMFERTSTEHAPWFVVPADRKWYARLAVQGLLVRALERIDPSWPPADYDVAEARERLLAS